MNCIDSDLFPDVKSLIRNTPLEKRTTELLKLSKLPPEEQYIVAKRAVANPEANLADLLRARTIESAHCHFAPEPKMTRIDPITYLISVEPKSVQLLVTNPPHNLNNLEKFISIWVPLAMSKLTDNGQAYIFSSSKPEEMQEFFSVLGMSERFVLTNVLSCHGPRIPETTPKQSYKHSWKAIFYLRGHKADPLDWPLDEEQFDVQESEKMDALFERLIRHSSDPFDFVLDPFYDNEKAILNAVARLDRIPLGCTGNDGLFTD